MEGEGRPLLVAGHGDAMPAAACGALVARLGWRNVVSVGVAAGCTAVWLVFVLSTGNLGRAMAHWPAGLTMVGGSFLAGSSPEGGGAVAFPVFTKVLHVKAPGARTFSLCIQSLGMSVASAVILLTRRKLDFNVLRWSLPGGIVGFLIGIFSISDIHQPFWPPRFPPEWIKVTFSIILAAMSFLMALLLWHNHHGKPDIQPFSRRTAVGVFGSSLVGGVISSGTGTGVNVCLFLFCCVACNLSPATLVPTTIIAMAAVSVSGLAVLVLYGDQFNTTFGRDSSEVVAIGGRHFLHPCPASECDLFGMFLGSAYIVVWGAPLGTFLVEYASERVLVTFIGLLALTEVVSTFVMVKPLHAATGLLAYYLAGILLGTVGTLVLFRHFNRRRRTFHGQQSVQTVGSGLHLAS